MENKVRVIVRTRPFLQEGIDPSESCVKEKNKNTLELTNTLVKTESIIYKFDSCYGMESTQEEIFAEIQNNIPDVLKGINTTIFAYGMTGAGKTHTMQGNTAQPGIIPRVVQYLMQLTSDQKVAKYEISVSYLEIYNEKIFDLLEPKDEDLIIRQGTGEMHVQRLAKWKIENYEEFTKTYATGCKNRTVAPTSLNDVSSRSHAILCIYVHTISNRQLFSGKLHLIDLAGSEDNRRTNNSGIRMTESSNINTSLFVLGKVVNALNEGSNRIPYRDSKLTRFLKDSLGGQSNAIMIANISPESRYYAETARTLNFASKSKKIINKPIVNMSHQPPEVSEEEKKKKLLEWKKSKVQKRRNSIDKIQLLKQKKLLLQQREKDFDPLSDRSQDMSISPLKGDSFFSYTSEQLAAEVIEQEVKRRLNEEKKALMSPWLKQQQVLENQRDRLEKLEKALLDKRNNNEDDNMGDVNTDRDVYVGGDDDDGEGMTHPPRKKLKMNKKSKVVRRYNDDDDDDDGNDDDYHDDNNGGDDTETDDDLPPLKSTTKMKRNHNSTIEKSNDDDNDDDDDVEGGNTLLENSSSKTKLFTKLKKSSQAKNNCGDKENIAILNGKAMKRPRGLSSPLSPSSLSPSSSSSASGASPTALQLLSPTTKDRTVKEFLIKGRDQERKGQLQNALTLYSNANSLLPKRNEKLDKKIQRLRVKLNLPALPMSDEQTSQPLTPLTPRRNLLQILNSGSEKELCKLHTVGAKRAKLIIQFRNQRPFDSFSDLKRAGFTQKILSTFLSHNLSLSSPSEL